jgi:hypothetical protein
MCASRGAAHFWNSAKEIALSPSVSCLKNSFVFSSSLRTHRARVRAHASVCTPAACGGCTRAHSLLLAEAAEEDLHALVHINGARRILVVHHELDDVEQLPRFKARLPSRTANRAVDRRAAAVAAEAAAAVHARAPDHCGSGETST